MGLSASAVPAIIGLLGSAAGTGLQISAAQQSRNAMNRQVVAQLAKQKKFQEQATPIYEKSLKVGGPDVAKEQVRQGAAEAAARISSMPTGSRLPVDEARLKGQVRQQSGAAAKSEGYANSALQRWLKNQQANNALRVISNLAGSSSRNSEALTALAGQKGADMAGIGSLLSTAGNLAAIYGGLNLKRGIVPGGQSSGAGFSVPTNFPQQYSNYV